MTTKNSDLPAMPITHEQAKDADMWGLTKREMMAMHMMAHLMQNERLSSYGEQAYFAIKAADALLAELERTE